MVCFALALSRSVTEKKQLLLVIGMIFKILIFKKIDGGVASTSHWEEKLFNLEGKQRLIIILFIDSPAKVFQPLCMN